MTEEQEKGAFGSKLCEGMVIGLLEELKLPMKEVIDMDASDSWFKPHGACLFSGYDFSTDTSWEKQLKRIQDTLISEVHINSRLLVGVDGLLSLFKQLNPQTGIRGTEETRLFLACALFDDSLESGSEDSNAEPPIRVARFRENLFFVGDASLYLALTTECYKRYPTASAGDLHMLRTCCIADDVLTYLMMKHGCYRFLFDQESESTQSLQRLISLADEYGRNAWANSNGWVLGQEEFAKRWESNWWSSVGDNDGKPNHITAKYSGLGGGCLYGESSKLGKFLTQDLAYSFKSIIGALVLSNGVECMWRCVAPMFEEILLLSPEETRQHYKTNITSTSQSGKRGRSVQIVQGFQASYGTGWSVL